MERDSLERTIVIKTTKKTHGSGNAPDVKRRKDDEAPKSPEEARQRLAAIASLYRLLRG